MHDLRACLILIGLVMAFGPVVTSLAAASRVSGIVRDASGAAVRDADVAVLTPEMTGIAGTTTGADGRFAFTVPAPGTYLLIVKAKAFADFHHAFTTVPGEDSSMEVVIHPAGVREDVTVTASRGTIQELHRAGQ